MRKEELKRIKASLLVMIMCFGLCSCKSDEDVNAVEFKKTDVVIEQENHYDYLIVFIEGKAIIYNEPVGGSIIRDGYVTIGKFRDSLTSIMQSPSVLIPGMDNAIEFASSVVGEDNIIFMEWNKEIKRDLIMKPNN